MKNLLLATTGAFAALLIAINTDARDALKTVTPKPLHGFSATPRATQLGHYVVPYKGKEDNATSATSKPTIQQNAQLSFIENKGQITDQYGKYRSDIDYKLDANGIVMFIGDGQVHYQWNHSENSKSEATNPNTTAVIQNPASGIQHQVSDIQSYRLDVTLLGANKNAKAVAEDMQAYTESYYLPQCPNGAMAHSYSKVTYKDVYPNIDWVVYVANSKVISQNQASSIEEPASSLKYDFVVHPGGNPADIKVQYNGATALVLNGGALTATTPYGNIIENAPYSYYADSKQEVSSSFKLNGNVLSYNITSPLGGGREGALVIDPFLKLNWSTYYGGSNTESAFNINFYPMVKFADIVGDVQDNTYTAGNAQSTSNIATTGSYQASLSAGMDGFIVKFNKAGARQWATYYGGSGYDMFTGIKADASGNLYVCGSTTSTGLATSGAYQSSNQGYADGIVAKFNNSGVRQWASYFGGSDSDHVFALTVDVNNNITIGGNTLSSGLATTGAYQTVYNGANVSGSNTYVAYISQFNNAGGLRWSTYYNTDSHATGTTNASMILTLACDDAGNIYAGGMTAANNLGTTGTFQPAIAAGQEGFIAKLNNNGAQQWHSYYADNPSFGVITDYTSSIVCDHVGNVYFGGSTNSTSSGTNLYTSGAFYTASVSHPGYLAKFNGSNGTRTWGTLLPTVFLVRSLVVDASNDLYVAGIANGFASPAPINTSGCYQSSIAGSTDGYLLELDTSGAQLYGTYFGGTGEDGFDGMVINTNTGTLTFAGYTESSTGIASSGAYQTTYGGNRDAFITSFALDTVVYIPRPYTDTLFCAGDSVHIPYEVNNSFRSGNTFTLQLSNATGSFVIPTNIGTRSSTAAGTINGRIPPNTAGGTGYRIRIVSTGPVRTSQNDSADIHIKAAPLNFGLASNSPVCEADTIRLFGLTSSPTSSVTWQWSGPLSFGSALQSPKIGAVTATMAGYYKLKTTLISTGCFFTDSVQLTTKPLPDKPVATSNTPVCFNGTLNLNATSASSGATFSWTGPTGFTSGIAAPTRSGVVVADGGSYIVTANLNGCITKDTEAVLVYPAVPAPVAGSNSPVCAGSDINLTASTVPGATYAWTGTGAYTANAQNPAITGAVLSNSGTYSVIASLNGCFSPAATTAVSVVQGPLVSAYPSPGDSICTGKTITLNALITGAVSSPVYQWLKNGNSIPGANKLTYTDNTTADGDVYSLVLTPGTGSVCTTPIQGKGIPITVLQYKAPAVSIAATDTNAWSGVLVNFTATSTDAGSFPKYQWKLNNKDVQGATSYTWGAATLSNGDNVCVDVTSTYMCPRPLTASTCHVVKIATGIHDVGNDNLHIYPNPAGNELHVDGLSTGTRIQLLDVFGRVVYSSVAASEKLTLNTTNLVTGNYILQLTDVNGVKNSYKVVKE